MSAYDALGLAYTVKKVIDFFVPSRDVTYQTLPGREKLNYTRLGTGKSITWPGIT
jgi:hypothetical protein